MTSLLPSADEMTQIRTDVQNMLLPDTCNILTLTRTANSQGGWAESWGTATSNVACRLDPISGREQMAGAALQPFYSYVLSLPYGTTLTEANRVEVGTAVYTVVSVDANKSWSFGVRAYLERATNA